MTCTRIIMMEEKKITKFKMQFILDFVYFLNKNVKSNFVDDIIFKIDVLNRLFYNINFHFLHILEKIHIHIIEAFNLTP